MAETGGIGRETFPSRNGVAKSGTFLGDGGVKAASMGIESLPASEVFAARGRKRTCPSVSDPGAGTAGFTMRVGNRAFSPGEFELWNTSSA